MVLLGCIATQKGYKDAVDIPFFNQFNCTTCITCGECIAEVVQNTTLKANKILSLEALGWNTATGRYEQGIICLKAMQMPTD